MITDVLTTFSLQSLYREMVGFQKYTDYHAMNQRCDLAASLVRFPFKFNTNICTDIHDNTHTLGDLTYYLTLWSTLGRQETWTVLTTRRGTVWWLEKSRWTLSLRNQNYKYGCGTWYHAGVTPWCNSWRGEALPFSQSWWESSLQNACITANAETIQPSAPLAEIRADQSNTKWNRAGEYNSNRWRGGRWTRRSCRSPWTGRCRYSAGLRTSEVDAPWGCSREPAPCQAPSWRQFWRRKLNTNIKTLTFCIVSC